METIAFYDTKPYDKTWFERLEAGKNVELRFLDSRLSVETAVLASGCRGACLFVNDRAGAEELHALKSVGVDALFLRCAGFNNVDLKAAEKEGIHVYRVPAYSPESVAEHAMALLLTLTRKTHRAFVRTRERNFSLDGLTGFDLYGKTVGVIGTGKVGMHFAQICQGFGMRVLANDPRQVWGMGIEYVRFDELCRRADVISLHCPLTPESYNLLNRAVFHMMRPGVVIINTSRGALIDSEALLEMIKSGKVGAVGLDVYEEEADVFYEDVSGKVMRDDTLNRLFSQPNVLVTSHQAFLTNEALHAIAETSLSAMEAFFAGCEVENRVTAEAMA